MVKNMTDTPSHSYPDIVERLRQAGPGGWNAEAADEIERLRPYVEAFRREEARADKLGTEVDDLRERLSAVAQGAWQPIEVRPELDHQPGRQFILLEGSCRHSDANWHRQFAGEAFIRKPGEPDEMLQYRMSDILRICHDGDIDPHTAKVTHWMPGAYPFFPSSVSSTQRETPQI